jgi:hypothetical protein
VLMQAAVEEVALVLLVLLLQVAIPEALAAIPLCKVYLLD